MRVDRWLLGWWLASYAFHLAVLLALRAEVA